VKNVSHTFQTLIAKFQLRYCPALAKKPRDKAPSSDEKPQSKIDPFANPSPGLLVAEIPQDNPSHNVLLNKYPVIPNHFILATKDNKPQTHVLEQNDLAMSYACLKAWREDATSFDEEQLFAFFNSGEHSGASQPHRHLQFLPVKDMRINKSKWAHPETFAWNPLISTMITDYHDASELNYTSNPALSFRHFATRLEDNETPSSLYVKYITLLKLGALATKTLPTEWVEYVDNAKIDEDGETNFSYNLAMTTEAIAVCPRRSDSASIPGLPDENSVSLNGTILGGTLMVKNEKEWDTLKDQPQILDDILETIGYPTTPPSQIQVSNVASTPDTRL
jgi:sulfate adenylyltransferase (ADP) / ATP adenylyltransferase